MLVELPELLPELLLEPLLDAELDAELPEDPLAPELLGDGMEADGVVGDVGVLAEGQPTSKGRQKAVTRSP